MNWITRRKAIKSGIASLAIGGGSIAMAGSASAQDWDYELVVKADGGDGEISIRVPGDEYQEAKVEGGEGVVVDGDILNIGLYVENYFLSQNEDIVRWNGPGLEDLQVVDIDNNIEATVNGQLIPTNAEYPFR